MAVLASLRQVKAGLRRTRSTLAAVLLQVVGPLCVCKPSQVGMAAPVCVAMIAEEGRDRENTLSEVYGGKGDAKAGANPLYEAIGDVST